MPKKIVFCADGTWDHPKSPAQVERTDSNVYKLYKSFAYTSSQFTTYDSGVGAGGNLFEHLIGGAFGEGLFQKVKDGYTAISHVYEQGDAIYIFGFSRGAYTARSLAGMIAACGLPSGGFDNNLIETAFNAYRHKDQRAALLASLERYKLVDAKITCLGVWDTVGELGIPVDPLGLDSLRYGFLDTNLHPDVQNAFHAVAIDERRREFPPTLWTPPFTPAQRVEQVWFAGVHCDVGGGYPETGLSGIALGWMLKNALSCGGNDPLELVNAEADQYLNLEARQALDAIHESWSILWGFPRRRTIAPDSAIANSVAIRVANDSAYRPENLQITGNRLAPNYEIEDVVPNSGLGAGASSS